MNLRRGVFTFAIAAAVLIGTLALIPTPYWIIAPGSAVDLSQRIAVDGHAPPSDRFYLTDVTVTRASALTLVARFAPEFRVVPQEVLLPAGESPGQYDRLLVDSMTQSQSVAAVVAERAAGFHVNDPVQRIVVAEIMPNSKAGSTLHVGDILELVAGRRVVETSDVAKLIGRMPAGRAIAVAVRRGDRNLSLNVGTIATGTGTRFGIRVSRSMEKPDLPVAVRYSLGNIAGSSGGLMFALQIYGALRDDRHQPGNLIAGTGALSSDGSVRPIEGTLQKLIAAKRAGARVFLVPRENYADVAAEREIRVVPVRSFQEALAALRS